MKSLPLSVPLVEGDDALFTNSPPAFSATMLIVSFAVTSMECPPIDFVPTTFCWTVMSPRAPLILVRNKLVDVS